MSTVFARSGTEPAVTVTYFTPIDLSWFSTPLLAAAPTRKASTLLYRSMPDGPRRLISFSVMSGTPLFVTYRTGASSGKWMIGVAVIAVSGSSVVSSVTARGRSGVPFGAFFGSADGQMCWVIETASWKGSAPKMRVVVFVAIVGDNVGDAGGGGTCTATPPVGTPKG